MIQRFPELLDIVDLGKISVYETTNFRQGILFSLPGIDLESKESESKLKCFQGLISSLAEENEVKLHLTINSCGQVHSETFRSEAFRRGEYLNRMLLLSIEGPISDPLSLKGAFQFFKNGTTRSSQEVERFIGSLPWFELDQLHAQALDRSRIKEVFALPCSSITKKGSLLDFGGHVLGVIRLYRQGVNSISQETVAEILQRIPLPCEVVVSARKYRKIKAELKLRALMNRQGAVPDITSQERHSELGEVLKATLLKGSSLVDLEWLLVLKRDTEDHLRRDLDWVMGHLAPLGDVMIETVGTLPSYLASRLGGVQHFTFSEVDTIAATFFPIASFGEGDTASLGIKEIPRRSLLVHREDSSPHVFDLLNPRFTASNTLISGVTGSGKSAFGNLLSSSLLSDPDVVLSKVDVGGSYKRECEIYKGNAFHFSLDQPSGINPFRNLKLLSGSNDAIATLSVFLATLIQEENETAVPKIMIASLEEKLKQYAEKVKDTHSIPNIDDFLKSDSDIPRRPLLMRWGKGGVFENALKEAESTQNSFNRYHYYNFENIVGASLPDFATGVMSAVIAQVNLEMLRIAHDKQSKQRFIFFCDETKFFVDNNAHFFLMTTANFRKFGHAVILMIQNIQDFLIYRDGQCDRGILMNSPIRVFFKSDMPEDFLKSEFHFSDRDLQAIVREPYSGDEYREAVLMDDLGKRIVRIYLNSEEIWRVTSTKMHNLKYEKLRNLIPELALDEVIRVLALEKEVFL